MILNATTKSIEMYLGAVVATNQLPFVASYVDITTTAFTPGENDGTSNDTTAVTVVAAPGASTQRQIKYVSIYNADTAARTVYIQYNNNATLRLMIKVTLAVGQTLMYMPETGWQVVQQSSGILQVVSTFTGAVATGATTMPGDDTIPQITEGDQYITLAITPKSAVSKLRIDVTAVLSSTGGSAQGLALFQDATANALAAVWTLLVANAYQPMYLTHIMTSGTTSSTTFRVRSGNHGAGVTTFNGFAGGRFYGGVMASGIIITEIAV